MKKLIIFIIFIFIYKTPYSEKLLRNSFDNVCEYLIMYDNV